ncbi:MAG: hypothetical protein JRF24_09370 [Deltaproteobacteria bacterium]|nr:hypothetical protein [Deltaproteobacteria bacterium]
MALDLDAPDLDILDKIYGIYDDYSKNLPVTCKLSCCLCCTQDVTITTLEGRRILKHPALSHDKNLLNLVLRCQDHPESQSPISTNAFARLCLQGQEFPQENQDIGQKTCIFLSRRQCLIYDDRPFGCRSFFSTQPCQEGGSAVVDPFLISINSIFLQFIEDIDEGGFFGPINNVLSFLAAQDPYRHGAHRGDPESCYHRQHLTGNIAMPAIMIPPEHEERIEPILKQLKAIRHRHHALSAHG